MTLGEELDAIAQRRERRLPPALRGEMRQVLEVKRLEEERRGRSLDGRVFGTARNVERELRRTVQSPAPSERQSRETGVQAHASFDAPESRPLRELPAEQPAPDQHRDLVEFEIVKRVVYRLLSETQRTIVGLRFGLEDPGEREASVREIARLTDIPRARVAQELDAALEAYRKALRDAGFDRPPLHDVAPPTPKGCPR